MQERSRQGRRRHAELGQDRRHGKGVRDVGITGATLLIPVQVGSGLVRPLEHAHIGLGVVLAKRPNQGVELGGTGAGPGETSEPRAQASGSGVGRDLAHRLLRHPHLPLL